MQSFLAKQSADEHANGGNMVDGKTPAWDAQSDVGRRNKGMPLNHASSATEQPSKTTQTAIQVNILENLMETQAKASKQINANADPHFRTKPKLLSNGKVKFATVDTRGNAWHRLQGPPGWDWAVQNLGAGKPWHGSMTKVKLMYDWVASLPDNQLVVFMDGGDVMYGGCDIEDFIARFEALSKVTNAPVIAGAEYNCAYPPEAGCARYPSHGRDEVLDEFHLKAEDLDLWRSTDKMSLKFLNSGFYMGRAKNLRELYIEWMAAAALRSGKKHKFTKGLDQSFAAEVLHERPDLLALDYASMLVSNLYGLRLEKDGQQLFSFSGASQRWENAATRKPVCFFHANGPPKRKEFQQLDETIMPTPSRVAEVDLIQLSNENEKELIQGQMG